MNQGITVGIGPVGIKKDAGMAKTEVAERYILIPPLLPADIIHGTSPRLFLKLG
jgi:hypothetical protein